MNKPNNTPTSWSFEEITGGLGPLFSKQKFGVSIYNALTKLAVLYKSGAIESSLVCVRKMNDIEILDFDEDFFPGPENGDINIWNFSTWLSELTDKEAQTLIEDTITALRKLKLPLTLIENYIGALLYDWEIRPALLPATMFGELSMLDGKFKNLTLTTQDKKYMTQEFRKLSNIPSKGRIPKDKLPAWKIFERNILSGKNTTRRYRSVGLKLAALESKSTKIVENPRNGKLTFQKKVTDAEIFERDTPPNSAYSDEKLSEQSRKGAQNIRKHRQRLKE